MCWLCGQRKTRIEPKVRDKKKLLDARSYRTAVKTGFELSKRELSEIICSNKESNFCPVSVSSVAQHSKVVAHDKGIAKEEG